MPSFLDLINRFLYLLFWLFALINDLVEFIHCFSVMLYCLLFWLYTVKKETLVNRLRGLVFNYGFIWTSLIDEDCWIKLKWDQLLCWHFCFFGLWRQNFSWVVVQILLVMTSQSMGWFRFLNFLLKLLLFELLFIQKYILSIQISVQLSNHVSTSK